MRRIALLAAMVSAFGCGGSSNTQTYSASLVQSNEPTAFQLVKSTATGTAAVQIVGTSLTYSLRATGLKGTASVAHIHLTPNPGGTTPAQGAVIVTFKVANTGATAGTTVTVDDSVVTAPDATAKNLDGTAMTFTDLVNHIKNGETYVNIHSTANPSGEIRGDLH